LAIARTTPVLLGLYALVALWANDLQMAQAITVRSAKWYRKDAVTFSAQAGAPNMAHYAASKGGMIGMTRALAKEFGPAGITVNTVPPRFITGTIMSDASFAASKQPLALQAEIDGGPICRAGIPEDIASAVGWLASEDAGFVTDQVIGVNGGRYI
jgi:2-hydroxycyclohexanecarboxyl-CoA dehydrogenase